VKISIEGHHYQVSEASRDYILSAAEKIERFYSPITECQITIKEEKGGFHADVVTRVTGQTLKSSNQDEKLYKAVDEALDKMARQLQKLHDRRRSHRPGETESTKQTGE
jgi:ribosomal subunit interface protein